MKIKNDDVMVKTVSIQEMLPLFELSSDGVGASESLSNENIVGSFQCNKELPKVKPLTPE